MKHLLHLKPHPNHKNHQSLQEKKSKGNKLPENKAKAFNTLRSKALNCSDSEVASTPHQIPNASTSLGFSFFPPSWQSWHVESCSLQLKKGLFNSAAREMFSMSAGEEGQQALRRRPDAAAFQPRGFPV